MKTKDIDKETPVKHTQTEWRLVLESKHEDENGDTWMEIQTPDGGCIAKVNLYPPMPHIAGHWYQTGIANGRLIAAAPKLIEACEVARIGMCGVGVPHAGERKLLAEAVELVSAALAKSQSPEGA